jgi:hypothetical protein
MADQITQISKLLELIDRTGLTGANHAHMRIWFRGQGDQSWHLEPGVCRPGFASDDKKRVNNERHLTRDFLTMSVRDYKSDAEAYFIQQHYRMPTRLLDWTLNPLAAVFLSAGAQGQRRENLLAKIHLAGPAHQYGPENWSTT